MAPLGASAEPPPPEETDRVKSKASMFDEALDEERKVGEAYEREQAEALRRKKAAAEAALRKKEEAARKKAEAAKRKKEEAKRRVAEAARKKKLAEEKAKQAKAAKAEEAAKVVDAAKVAQAAKKAATKVDNASAAAPTPEDIRAQRRARADAQRKQALVKMKKSVARSEDSFEYINELKRHNRRLARLHRIQKIAQKANDEETAARAQKLVDQENARHTRVVNTFGGI